MKLGTITRDGRPVPILLGKDGRARTVREAADAALLGDLPDLLALVRRAGAEPGILAALARAADSVPGFGLDGADWAAPLANPSKILGVAFNNRELVKTAHRDPGVPNFFLKPPSALTGHGKPIIVDPSWGAVIPEPELCAVIGRRAKHVREEDALDHVFGYLIHNDVTSHGLKFGVDSIAVTYDGELARPEFYDWRRRHGPDDTDAYFVYHARSKGTDTFGPMGPWITTAGDVPDPNGLEVRGTLDGETFALDHTGNYRFSIEACIAEASRYFTLEPGDLISFGTTGRGAGRFPRGHKSLLIGEEQGVIGIEIAPLGRLESPILHRKGGA